jgi:hypothetical protein
VAACVIGVSIAVGVDWAGIPETLKTEGNDFLDDVDTEWQELMSGAQTRTVPQAPPVLDHTSG